MKKILLFLTIISSNLSTINYGMETDRHLKFYDIQSQFPKDAVAKVGLITSYSNGLYQTPKSQDFAQIQAAFSQNKQELARALINTRPCIELTGINARKLDEEPINLPNQSSTIFSVALGKIKNDKSRETHLTQLLKDELNLTHEKMDWVFAEIVANKVNMTTRTNTQEEPNVFKKGKSVAITLLNNTEGNTLFIDPTHFVIFVGCTNGDIQVIDIETRKIKVWKGHQAKPVHAIRLACNNNIVVSQVTISEEKVLALSGYNTYLTSETLLWDFRDIDTENPSSLPIPRAALDNCQYTSCYVTNTLIIRSNVGGKFLGIGDLAYTIPTTWLSRKSPANIGQATFIYAIGCLLAESSWTKDNQQLCQTLYTDPELEILPSCLTAGIKHDLAFKAQENKQTLYENLIDPIV